ncbi:hypothetical protein J437_LFUL007340 [Ladona fulva]|uniref:Uncharacterized protein n=1 Tax=Ladona fulva TaxID=123851 RepID=A0A8K0KIA0_LADFU|nr:hypothetical protein J437_LFUL007340 [Ladona fulva]
MILFHASFQASDVEIVWCTRICVLIVGIAASGVAFGAESIYGLWYLSSDLTYVLTFPHFVLSMTAPGVGTRLGSVSSFIVGIVLRVLVGEKSMGLPSLIKFPEEVPVKTLTMALSATVLLLVSICDKFLRSKFGCLGIYNIATERRVFNDIDLRAKS